jgi:hypothetical protein
MRTNLPQHQIFNLVLQDLIPNFAENKFNLAAPQQEGIDY